MVLHFIISMNFCCYKWCLYWILVTFYKLVSLLIELHLPPPWIVALTLSDILLWRSFWSFSGFRGCWSHHILINRYTKAEKWRLLKSFPSPIPWYTDKFSSSNGGYLLSLYVQTLQRVVSWTYMTIRTIFFFRKLCRFHNFTHILWSFSYLQRAQDLANVTSYREWVLFGYLVCPDELLRVTSIDIASVPSKDNCFMFCVYLLKLRLLVISMNMIKKECIF